MKLTERRWLLSALLGSLITLPAAAQESAVQAGEVRQDPLRNPASLQQQSQIPQHSQRQQAADGEQSRLQTQQRTRTQTRLNQPELGQARRSEAQRRQEQAIPGGFDSAPGAAGDAQQGSKRSGGGRGR